MLLIEISPMIAAAVEEFIRASGTSSFAPTLRDPAGHARVIQAKRASHASQSAAACGDRKRRTRVTTYTMIATWIANAMPRPRAWSCHGAAFA